MLVLAHSAADGRQLVAAHHATQVRLRLIGAPSGVWQLQGSANLVNWQPITLVTNTTGVRA